MEKCNKKIAILANAFSQNEILMNSLKEIFSNYVIGKKQGVRYTPQEMIFALKDADGAVISMDMVNEEVLKECSNLKVVSKYGVGLSNINFEDCKKYGVTVKYKEGTNKTSVAELTLGFMLALSRNLYENAKNIKQGIWNKKGGMDLSEKTIGMIGVGHIGRELVKLLKPFNCRILVNDIRKDPEQLIFYEKNNLESVSKEEIYKNADIITIHTFLDGSTENLINMRVFESMKPTSYLINAARAEILNEKDLLEALKRGIIAGAALDVYPQEPPENKELLALDNLFCTPHIGGNSKEAILNMGNAVIEGLKEFFENGS